MRIKFILYSFVALFMVSGCSDNLDSDYQILEGEPIRFAAYIEDTNSRTSYGELTEGKWPIYWENNDQVLVYCPQAHSDGANMATYTVTDNTNVGTSGEKDTYKLEGLNTLKWGSTNMHHFYTFYPADRVFTKASVNGKEEGTLVFSVNREQKAKVYDKNNNGVNDYAVDMNSAVMAGYVTYERSKISYKTLLSLPFEPIATALDIEIVAPQRTDGTTNQYKSITITGITISDAERNASSAQPIAGGFYWNHRTKTFEAYENTNSSITTDGTSSTIHVNFEEPITLPVAEPGETPEVLTVTAFLLPKIPEQLQITVRCDGNNGLTANLVRTVKKSSDADGKKCSVAIGKLPNPVSFTYESWMASLDDKTYVSQISMPGTHDAGAYQVVDIWDGLGQCQTLDIIEQLNAGIRVLDFRPQWQGGTGFDEDASFSIAHGMITYGVTFENVMDQVLVWLAEHPTEFVMILLKNEYGTGDATNSSNRNEFFGWQRNIRDRMEKINPNFVIKDFNPSMTLGEGRGKIVFISRDYYVPSNISDDNWSSVMQAQIDGTYNQSTYVDWYGGKVAGWPDNNASWNRTIYTNSNPDGGTGTFYVSDLYGGALGQGPNTGDKEDAISNMLSEAANSTLNSNWYLTWLNARGSNINFIVTVYGRETSYWNNYATSIISGYTRETYQKTGVVMLDWAASSNENDNYNGFDVIEAVINNNWLTNGEQGPAKEQ